MNLFNEFDFALLDDRDFKEDSVREEIIVPLLRELGYAAGTTAKIVRSKGLIHPYVYIGSKKHNVNIIPDYLLLIDENHKWILDAKAPNERIDKGKNPEQAYSYAIHPEVRAQKYALCNGRQLAVFEINRIEPVLMIEVKEIESRFSEVHKILSPIAFSNPRLLTYMPDFGLYLWKMGATEENTQHFIDVFVSFVARIEDDLYTISCGINFDTKFLASFDFGSDLYHQLLNSVKAEDGDKISEALKRQPYFIKLPGDTAPKINIKARLQDAVLSNEDEDYSPFIAEEFSSFPY